MVANWTKLILRKVRSDLKLVGAIRRIESKAYHRRCNRSGASGNLARLGIATETSPVHVSRRFGMFDYRRMIPGCTSGVMVETIAARVSQLGLLDAPTWRSPPGRLLGQVEVGHPVTAVSP